MCKCNGCKCYASVVIPPSNIDDIITSMSDKITSLLHCFYCRFYAAAANEPDQRKRLELLTQHVLDMWLDALSYRASTGCQPLIVKSGCDKYSPWCGGMGNRLFAVQMALWQARSYHVRTPCLIVVSFVTLFIRRESGPDSYISCRQSLQIQFLFLLGTSLWKSMSSSSL